MDASRQEGLTSAQIKELNLSLELALVAELRGK
jgi:hypothetical protein